MYAGSKVRRPEGFHVILTLLMALSFYDPVELEAD